MTGATRRWILRANALYLGIASVFGLIMLDFRGIVLGAGPAAQVLAAAPHAGVGFVEAHGLALILSVLIWRFPIDRFSHLAAAATMALLGVSNVFFWAIFSATGTVPMGIVFTSLHFAFAAAQLAAATKA